MKKWVIVGVALGLLMGLALPLLVLSSPFLLRKDTVPLLSNGKVVATAKRPSATSWGGNKVGVYAGNSKIFSMLGDIWSFPIFIYPFADAQRFLCIYDDDTAVLVFVVDSNLSRTNALPSAEWPPNDYLRGYLAQRASSVVAETRCSVRLPSYAELEEASSNLVSMPPRQFKATSFPCADLGLYRSYWGKEDLLSALHTNRQGAWP
jgi:hypothetical protein